MQGNSSREKQPQLTGDAKSFPLSHGQQAMWFLYQMAPQSIAYNIYTTVLIGSELDLGAWHRAWLYIVERHQLLRTTYTERDGQPVQVVHPYLEVDVKMTDASSWSEDYLKKQILAEADRPYNLETGPVLRVHLFTRSALEHIQLLAMHHIAGDMWSFDILLDELRVLYAAEVKTLPPASIQVVENSDISNSQRDNIRALPTLSYTDYVRWQTEMLVSSKGEQLSAYWHKQLAGELPLLDLPVDKLRPSVQTYRGATHIIELDEERLQKLRELEKAEGVSLYTILLAAFFVQLYRLSGQEDILVGSPMAGRSDRKPFKEIVGYFTNPVVCRANLSGNPTFQEFLDQVHRTVFGALRHQDYPFPLLVKQLAPQRDTSRSPLFQVLFTWQKHRWYDKAQKSPLSQKKKLLVMSPYSIEGLQRGAAFDLNLAVVEAGSSLQLCWQYNTDLFDDSTIARQIRHFQTLLEGIVTNPEQRVSELPLLTERERYQLLVEWNNTTKEYPFDKCIHQLFEEQVLRSPDAIAVVFEDKQLTYRELNQRANRIAHHLKTLGVGPEVLVGICVERSLEMVVGLLGILKAGGAYVPLDPAYPQERLAYVLNDSQVSVLLTQEKFFALLAQQDVPVLSLDKDWGTISLESEENPVSDVKPENLAYVIYTSGSTGNPKGVLINHHNVVRLFAATKSWFNFSARDVWTLFHSYAFDFSVWEIGGALISGGRLVIVPYLVSREPEAFYDLLCQEKVTVLNQTPSAFRQLIKAEQSKGTAPNLKLRLVIFGGEALELQSLKPWFERHGDQLPQLINMYGITETTVHVTYRPLTRADLNIGSSMIGSPIPDLQVYILDQNLQPVPIGVKGEIHVGGAGLARGYLNRPDLTAYKFIPNLFSHKQGDRLYKTGDLARYLSDGNIEYLGRIDHQVKIRGFRIELGEIETVLTAHSQVLEAAVIERENTEGNKSLVAYVVARSQSSIKNKLRDFLKQKLPDYMVPGIFVILDALPLTPNGKVDRRALPAPSLSNDSDSLVFPRTSNEEILAGIWKDVLGLEIVGVHDNFFELGGDSIISFQIIARANQAGLQITTKQLFQHQTIASLALVASTTSSIKADQGLVTGVVPLTPIQHWFFDQNWSEPNHFNQSMLLVVPPDLKPELLEQVVKELMVHHDALRMQFVRDSSGWQQILTDDCKEVPLLVIDLSAIGVGEHKAAIEQRAAKLQTTLNLEEGPLLRVVLFNLGSDRPGRLLLIIHHLVVDGVSWRILLEDIARACQQLEQGSRIQLPPKTTSFKNWAIRQRDFGLLPAQKQELDYWLTDSCPHITPIPVDYPAGLEANTEGSTAEISVFLSEEETRIFLQEVPSVYNTQINDVLLTALVQTFAEWTGSCDLLLEIEGHGREELFNDVDLSRTVGWFTAMFPVRLQLGEASTPEVALKSIKEQLRRIPNRGIGYGILRYLSQNADRNKQLQALPKPEVSFNYLGQFDQMRFQPVWQRFAQEKFGWSFSPKAKRSHLLDVVGQVVEGKLLLTMIYSQNIHRHSTIERLATEYNSTLKALIAHCTSPEAGGYTPTDFPLADLDQQELDDLLDLIDDKPNKSKNIESIYPLSPMQEGMLFHTLKEPESGIYFEQISFTIQGHLALTAFERAWRQVVERHPVLRTFVVWKNRTLPLQIVRKSVILPWTILDWRELSPIEQEHQLEVFLQTDRNKGFELEYAPLMRCALIQLADETYKFVWSFHHLLMDGWCMPIIFKEVFAFYEASKKGFDLHLSATRPYSDYIAWLQQQDKSKAIAYWQGALKGFNAPTPLVVDRTIGPNSQQKKIYLEHDLRLSATATATLKSLSQKHRITLSTFVQGVWALLLSRYSGEENVIFGVTVSGRPPALSGVESMVGLFINTLPVRVQVESETELLPWLMQLQLHQVEREQNSESSLSEIQRTSEIPPGSSLFESIVVFENYPDSDSLLSPSDGLQIDHLQAIERTNYPLTLVVIPSEELWVRLIYDGAKFDGDTIARMTGHFQTLLEGMVAKENHKLKDLPLLTSAESHQLLVEWNNTTKEYPIDKCIHQLFEEQVERSPDAVAVIFEDKQLTYLQMNQRANIIAHHLRTLGVGPEVLVGICVERSLEMVVGLLGILKAGGAYVPLDPEYPTDRLSFMLQDAQVSVLLTQQRLVERLPEYKGQFVYLDTELQVISRSSEENPITSVQATNLAYVIYTSGSTGQPKGVAMNHFSLGNLILWQLQNTTISSGAKTLQFAPVSFDVSFQEMFSTWCSGGTLLLIAEELRRDAFTLLGLLQEKAVERLFLPFVGLQQIAEVASARELVTSNLREIITAGQQLQITPAISSWLSKLTNCTLHNHYGPSESHLATTFPLTTSVDNWPLLPPIGRPIANTQIYILDSHLQPVPISVPGELHIGGAGLAPGYLNRPELTQHKFIPNPFSTDGHSRLYKTGDLARYLPDGNIEYLGRIDNQVKVRGFRIELGEIEAVLSQHPSVHSVVVIARQDTTGDQRLVAYIVPQQDTSPTISELRQFLKTKLPPYMVPNIIMMLESLPLTPNGKVDCRALPAPELHRELDKFVAPRTAIEEMLAHIWASVLKVKQVGIHDNFFELGGHSLLATQVVSRINSAFGLDLPIQIIFESATVAEIASYMQAVNWAAQEKPVTEAISEVVEF